MEGLKFNPSIPFLRTRFFTRRVACAARRNHGDGQRLRRRVENSSRRAASFTATTAGWRSLRSAEIA